MQRADERTIEETLIRDVLGWRIVDDLGEVDDCPAACWSRDHGCFQVIGPGDDGPRPFRPARCLRDAWEVQEALEGRFRPHLARPVWECNVRVVASFGSKEVVVEARSLPWTLSMALCQAARDGLVD